MPAILLTMPLLPLQSSYFLWTKTLLLWWHTHLPLVFGSRHFVSRCGELSGVCLPPPCCSYDHKPRFDQISTGHKNTNWKRGPERTLELSTGICSTRSFSDSDVRAIDFRNDGFDLIFIHFGPKARWTKEHKNTKQRTLSLISTWGLRPWWRRTHWKVHPRLWQTLHVDIFVCLTRKPTFLLVHFSVGQKLP